VMARELAAMGRADDSPRGAAVSSKVARPAIGKK